VNRKVLVAGLLVVAPLLFVLFANLGRDPHMVDSPLIGKTAPPFALEPVGGGAPVALAALSGKPVVVNFWATWCVPCFAEHPVLAQAARAMGGDVQFLGVIYEDEEDRVAAFLKRQPSPYPSLMDDGGKTAIAYGVYGVPETYFIDARGTIAAKHVGPLDARLLSRYVRMAMESGAGGGAGGQQ